MGFYWKCRQENSKLKCIRSSNGYWRNGERKNLNRYFESTIDTQDELPFSDEELCRELKEAFESTSAEITSDITDDLVEAFLNLLLNYLYVHPVAHYWKSISPDDSSDVLQILNKWKYVRISRRSSKSETLKILERLSNKGLTDRPYILPGTKVQVKGCLMSDKWWNYRHCQSIWDRGMLQPAEVKRSRQLRFRVGDLCRFQKPRLCLVKLFNHFVERILGNDHSSRIWINRICSARFITVFELVDMLFKSIDLA